MNMFVAAKTTVAAAVDEFFNRVTLLLNTNTTNGAQNNTFQDSSSNTFPITRNPATGPNAPTQGTFTPFSQTGWSNFFDGTDDYLAIADNALLRFGAGAFTLEAWIWRNVSGAAHTIYAKGGASTGIVFQVASTNVLRFTHTTTNIDSTGTISANSWTHVAVVREGTGTNQTKLYINGTQDGQGTVSTDFTQTEEVRIGTDRGATADFNGYISNLRFVKGTALYTTTFTPSTTPLTTTSQGATATEVELLTCQSNRFLDNSLNAFAITTSGSPSVQAFSPFAPTTAYDTAVVGGSGYFDGTNDYLTTAYNAALSLDTGDFCVEAYVYKTAASGNDWKLIAGSSASATMFIGDGGTTSSRGLGWGNSTAGWTFISGVYTPVNEWAHICYTRLSGVGRIFLNGYMRAYTASNTTTLSLGSATMYICSDTTSAYELQGYMSDLRITKGSVPTGYQTSATTPSATTQIFVPPTAPVTQTSQGASSPALILNCINAGIYDAAAKNVLETVGTAQVSTTQTKFGTTSMSFPGTSGNRFQSPLSQNYAFLTGDFTIEAFVYLNAVSATPSTVVGTWLGASNFGWILQLNSTTLTFAFGTSGGSSASYSPSFTFTTGTWYYLAVTRSGTNLKLFVNGSQVGTTQTNSANITCTTALWVGANQDGNIQYLNGYVDELRITKGFARTITATPTAAFPVQ